MLIINQLINILNILIKYTKYTNQLINIYYQSISYNKRVLRNNIIVIESGAIFSSTCAIISADAGPYGSWAGMIANNGTRKGRREDFTQVADVIFFSHKLAEEKFLAVEEIVSTSVNEVRVATYGCGGNLDAIYV